MSENRGGGGGGGGGSLMEMTGFSLVLAFFPAARCLEGGGGGVIGCKSPRHEIFLYLDNS